MIRRTNILQNLSVQNTLYLQDKYFEVLISIKYPVGPGEGGTMKGHICPTLDGSSLRGGREKNLNHFNNYSKTHRGEMKTVSEGDERKT